MKTTISILLTAFFGLFLSVQVNAQSCIYCNSNTISGTASAIGEGNIASGDYSLAVGNQSESIGNTSFAAGFKAKALGDYSIGLGVGAEALKYRSFAIGTSAISDGDDSYAFGVNVKSTATGSITFGFGPLGSQFLENTTEYSMIFGFGSVYPTLFIRKSYAIDKTGRIGIGNVTSPEAKLHIRADDNEDASLFLETTSQQYSGKLMIGDENHSIKAKPESNFEFTTETDKNFVFQNGSIFIQDSFEGLILKSPDGQCWKGTASNDGDFILENVDCSQLTGNENPSDVSQKAARIFPNPTGNKVFVEIPAGTRQPYVSVYNEQGVLLLSMELSPGKNPVSLKRIAKGVLIVKVFNSSGEIISTEKIMHK